jgi:hypothetical protein
VPLAGAAPAYPDVHDIPTQPSVMFTDAKPVSALQDA